MTKSKTTNAVSTDAVSTDAVISPLALVVERIMELDKQGLTKTKIVAHLTIEDIPPKLQAAAFEECNMTKSKPVTFASAYYDWLAYSARTAQEAHDYIMGDGEYGETSKNVQAHRSHYLNIWELAQRVRSNMG